MKSLIRNVGLFKITFGFILIISISGCQDSSKERELQSRLDQIEGANKALQARLDQMQAAKSTSDDTQKHVDDREKLIGTWRSDSQYLHITPAGWVRFFVDKTTHNVSRVYGGTYSVNQVLNRSSTEYNVEVSLTNEYQSDNPLSDKQEQDIWSIKGDTLIWPIPFVGTQSFERVKP